MKPHRFIIPVTLLVVFVTTAIFKPSFAGAEEPAAAGNKPERLEWFQDLAFGMFIHWSVDSQLGSVISHSMAGASQDYLDLFVNELPRTFNPKKFDPDDWARLAKLAGMKYVVFTTKHSSGFCMFDTKLSDFSVMNTPYGRDITFQIVDAFRRQGIHIGFYFCPDEFLIQYKQGHEISRLRPEILPQNNKEIMDLNKGQVRELFNNYGPVDIMFIDGVDRSEELKRLVWQMQPNTVITRSEMETPEQKLPDKPIPGPWEACETIGNQWHYKPTNEDYKSGTRLIETLVEVRAKGGNLLLNVGPSPDGEIPEEQAGRLREMALWLYVNGEAIYDIRPWHIIREDNIWFTRSRDCDTVYAIVTGEPWPRGEWKTVTLKSVTASDKTEVSVLGHGGRVLEYRPDVDPAPSWSQDDRGLHLTAMRAQRLYDNEQWPNPVVLKITHASPVQ